MKSRKWTPYLPFIFGISFLLPLVFFAAHKELAHLRNWQYLATVLALPALIAGWRHPRQAPPTFARYSLAFAATALLTLFCAAVTSKFFAVRENGIDFSVFDWMLVNTLRGDFMYSPLHRLNHMGVHTSWILFALVPLKWLVSHPLFLSLISATVLWAGVFPLWKLARGRGLDEYTAALLVLAFATCSFLGTVVNGGFRIEVFFPLFLLSFLYCWDRNRKIASLLLLLGLLSIKEDIALYVGGFFLGELLTRPERRRHAAMGAVIALGTLFVNLLLVQPYFLAQHEVAQPEYLKFWAHYGSSRGEIIAHMIASPGLVLRDIATSGWWKLYVPLLALPLLDLSVLLASLPGIFLLGTAASYPAMHQYGHYYPIILVCFAFFGLVRLLSHFRPETLRRYLHPLLLIFPLLFVGYVRIFPPDLQMFNDLRSVRKVLETDFTSQTICSQGVAFAYLGYDLKLQLLDETCASQDNAIAVIALDKDPFPFTESNLTAFVNAHKDAILHRTGSIYVIQFSEPLRSSFVRDFGVVDKKG